jgi:hypothetical protein
VPVPSYSHPNNVIFPSLCPNSNDPTHKSYLHFLFPTFIYILNSSYLPSFGYPNDTRWHVRTVTFTLWNILHFPLHQLWVQVFPLALYFERKYTSSPYVLTPGTVPFSRRWQLLNYSTNIQRCISVFNEARHWTLPWVNSIHILTTHFY